MFTFSPALLMVGTWTQVGVATATALVGVTCLAGSLHGYYLGLALHWQRALLFVAAIGLIKPGLATDTVGGVILALVLTTQWRARSAPAAPVGVAVREES